MPAGKVYFKGYDQQTPSCFYRMAFFTNLSGEIVSSEW